jgi:hypothetical protein
LDSEIEITFSERMSAKITEESIFISPLPEKPFDFKWRGKKLILTPQEPLQLNRTYVISVGTDAQDLRRNHLHKPHTSAFSTGNRMDRGRISGEVWTKQEIGLGREMGTSVWAYLLFADKARIDPEEEKPDYVTQTDGEGKFVLENLSLGKYRLFAVQDENRDLSWNWEKEAIGVTTQDIELSEQDISKKEVNFVLGKKDKGKPNLLNCQGVSKNLIRVEFDEEMDDRSRLEPANFRIFSVTTQNPLKVISVFFQDENTKRVSLLTEQIMNPQEEYELKVSNVRDVTGNLVDTASNTCIFKGSEIVEMAGPSIVSISPKEREIDVPFDIKIKLTFDQPPEPGGVEASFSLIDSNGIKISGKSDWENPNNFIFSPHTLLSGKMRYQIKLSGNEITDLLGNTSIIDSVFTSSFFTVDPNILGSVSGRIEMEERKESAGLILILWPHQKDKSSYQLPLSGPGLFLFERILPGKYFIGGYLDLDEDETLSLGQPEPFSPMEPFTIYPDTIHVRSRWETEGVELKFQ